VKEFEGLLSQELSVESRTTPNTARAALLGVNGVAIVGTADRAEGGAATAWSWHPLCVGPPHPAHPGDIAAFAGLTRDRIPLSGTGGAEGRDGAARSPDRYPICRATFRQADAILGSR